MGSISNGHNVYVLMLIGMNKYTYIYACTYVMMKLLNEKKRGKMYWVVDLGTKCAGINIYDHEIGTKCAGLNCTALSVRVWLYSTKCASWLYSTECADLIYTFESLWTLSVRHYWVDHGQRIG